jgi:hypothetical protein
VFENAYQKYYIIMIFAGYKELTCFTAKMFLSAEENWAAALK